MKSADSPIKHKRRFGLFEFLILVAVAAFGIFAQSFLFSKGDTVYVRTRVIDRDIQYIDEGMPLSRLAALYKTGMQSKDGLGRVTAEIVAIEGFDRKYNTDTFTEKEDVYVVMKLRASYSQRSGGYTYQGMTIAAGEWLNVNFGTLTVHGFILAVSPEPIKDSRQPVVIDVLYQAPAEANGQIDQYLADAIKIGDSVPDAAGNIIAEVVEKRVEPAKVLTVDQRGSVHTMLHTVKKDIYLTLRVLAEKRNGEYHYQDSVAIKTGGTFPLFFPKLILYPKVIGIRDAGK
ncbi:hypothetical protein HZB58_04865 [Candidatus Gottesmanbacteria bacterium]|nr:hypothetical protein [Candidatus Gottesmanbacteria bacterium]